MRYFSDLAEYFKIELLKAGYKFKAKDDREITTAFLNAYRKQIPAAPRRVHIADSLRCPLEAQRAFKSICKKSKIGKSLRPYQSDKIINANRQDGLFNDWLIHHFHLGIQNAQGEVKRSDYLLFAIIMGADMYCIDILPHADKKAWYRKELVDTAYRNWPEIFQQTKLNGILPSKEPMLNSDIEDWRKVNVGYALTMHDGTVHMGLGMGTMSSGDSMQVMREVIRLKWLCSELEKRVEQYFQDIQKDAEKYNVTLQAPSNLRLRTDGKMFGLYHEETETFFRMDTGIPVYSLQ